MYFPAVGTQGTGEAILPQSKGGAIVQHDHKIWAARRRHARNTVFFGDFALQGCQVIRTIGLPPRGLPYTCVEINFSGTFKGPSRGGSR